MNKSKLSKNELHRQYQKVVLHNRINIRVAKICACALRVTRPEDPIFNPKGGIFSPDNLAAVDKMLSSGEFTKYRAELLTKIANTTKPPKSDSKPELSEASK